jgi:hypothetical protein
MIKAGKLETKSLGMKLAAKGYVINPELTIKLKEL